MMLVTKITISNDVSHPKSQLHDVQIGYHSVKSSSGSYEKFQVTLSKKGKVGQ